jgi:hypothetical protein
LGIVQRPSQIHPRILHASATRATETR